MDRSTWEVRSPDGTLMGRASSKDEAYRQVESPFRNPLAPDDGGRSAYLAEVLKQLVPPRPGFVYRVVEIPTSLLGTPGDPLAEPGNEATG